MKKAAIAALVALLAGTGLVLFIGGGLSTRAQAMTCAPGEPLSVADVPEGEVAGYSGDQLRHAATILRVGAQKGADVWGQTIGIMTAIGESSLRNVDHGDDVGPDSRGLFQQRDNWGPLEDRMDPATAAGMFFDALLQVERWRELEPTIAAHRVQRNADPLHYAEHWDAAADVVTALAGVTAQPSGGNRYDLGPVKPHTQALAEEIGTHFGVDEVGGYRASAVDSGGHPAGLAVDFMTHDDTATGDAIAAYAIEHAERLSVDYIIWQQHYWSAAKPETGWQPMADRGSRTANHLDHPHINVTPTPNPSAAGGPVGCLAATIGGAPIAAMGDWVAPLDAPITSRFGPRNLLGGTFHYGTDFGAACGTPIYAAADGMVTYTGGPHRGLTGNVIFLDHGAGVETSYNHMYSAGILVRPGQQVTAGEVIALVGNAGNSTGCHLHYAVHTGGQPIDPEPFMARQGVSLG